jgi:dihydrofolate synthase/folylpolyglutamate synthase
LSAAGYRTGLRTSPYLQVATEKLQIGPALIDGRSFDDIVKLVLAQSQPLQPLATGSESLSYAEAWAALSLSWFAKRHVDVAVVEVGAGGRFDTTNVVDPLVSVITSVGLDHVVSLGPTIADIAWHKAGIIKPGSTAVVGRLPHGARSVVQEVARSVGAPVVEAGRLEAESPWASTIDTDFQRLNADTAYAAIAVLRRRGFTIPDAAVREGLANARLPGRLERMPADNPTVWLDGAHNADKMAALSIEVQRLFDGRLPVIVAGVLGAKDASAMVGKFNQLASTVVATEPKVVGKSSFPASSLAEAVRARGFTGPILIESDGVRALDRARCLARSQGSEVLVTGSLYLVGQIRGCWYPNVRIVVQRTSWPATRGAELDVG